MFAVTAIPRCFFFAATFLVPRARDGWLQRVATSRPSACLSGWAAQLMRAGPRDFKAAGGADPQLSILRELSSPGMAKVLLLGVTLAVLQQWCGINVIFNYAQEIFAAAGYQVSGILFNIVITGAVNLVFT